MFWKGKTLSYNQRNMVNDVAIAKSETRYIMIYEEMCFHEVVAKSTNECLLTFIGLLTDMVHKVVI